MASKWLRMLTQIIPPVARVAVLFNPRPVAVPLEALGMEGGHLVSLDMSPSEYAAAPTWHDTGATPLPADATVRVALSRS
jgi:hypothetical protein